MQPEPVTASEMVKHIALMGVTHSAGEDQAWLVDLSTQEREIVDEGEAAWGFTVKDIEQDQVVLAQGSEEFTLRLGEKEIPVVASPADTAIQKTVSSRRVGASGGPNRSLRRGRFRPTRTVTRGPRTANRSSGRRSNRARRTSSSNRNRSRRTSGASGFRRGFNPAAARFGSGFYGNRRNGLGSGNAGPTSNPQTARRRGGQLIGGADPIEPPAPIRNPQTVRRLGTNYGGRAFGATTSRNRSGSAASTRSGRSRGR